MIGWLKTLFGLGGAQVPADEAAARMRDGAALVDVREPAEFARGHAPGARLLPLSRIRADTSTAIESLGLPEGTNDVLLVCQSGVRSRIAQAMLAKDTRHRCVNIAGGMNAWAAAGLPVTPPHR